MERDEYTKEIYRLADEIIKKRKQISKLFKERDKEVDEKHSN